MATPMRNTVMNTEIVAMGDGEDRNVDGG